MDRKKETKGEETGGETGKNGGKWVNPGGGGLAKWEVLFAGCGGMEGDLGCF